MPSFKFEYIWSEEKLRQLHKRQLIIMTVGIPFPLIYALSLQQDTPYRLFIGIAPFIFYAPINFYNLFSLNKPNQGLRFILTYLNVQTTAILLMAVTGGFRSPLQFIPMVIMFLAGIFIGPIAGTVVILYTIFLFFGMYLWLLTMQPSMNLTQDFFLNLAIFSLVGIIQRDVGKELSLQFEAKKKLEQVDDLKNQFITLSSHYLRTPLTIIKGRTAQVEQYIFGMPHTESKDQQVKYIQDVEIGINQLDELIDKFLTISSIEHGDTQILALPSDMTSLVKEVANGLAPLAEKQGVRVTLDIRVPELQFKFDRNKIRDVLGSLIENAILYNKPKGSVTVSLLLENNNAVIKVVDTGVGISKEQIENMFSSFNKGGMDKVLSFNKPGTGLSLFLCKLIIDAHKGRINVDSQEGVGSDFTVILPMGLVT